MIIFQSERGFLPLLYWLQNLSADIDSEDIDEADEKDDADEELNEEFILNISNDLLSCSLLKCGQSIEIIWGVS